MRLDRLLADPLDLAQGFQRARRAPGQFDRLAVRAQNVGRQSMPTRCITAPLHDAPVAGNLDFVQFAQERGKCSVSGRRRRRRAGGRMRERRQVRPSRRALQDPRLQVDGAAHGAVVAEEVRLGAQHLAIGQVAVQGLVVEETCPRVEGHGDDADFTHEVVLSEIQLRSGLRPDPRPADHLFVPSRRRPAPRSPGGLRLRPVARSRGVDYVHVLGHCLLTQAAGASFQGNS